MFTKNDKYYNSNYNEIIENNAECSFCESTKKIEENARKLIKLEDYTNNKIGRDKKNKTNIIDFLEKEKKEEAENKRKEAYFEFIKRRNIYQGGIQMKKLLVEDKILPDLFPKYNYIYK